MTDSKPEPRIECCGTCRLWSDSGVCSLLGRAMIANATCPSWTPAAHDIRAAVLAERERCVKDVCSRCADPDTFTSARRDHLGRWQHFRIQARENIDLECYAEDIHERAAREVSDDE